MYFKQFLHDDLRCSSYFIASRDSREAAVLDPHRDVQQYLDLAAERGYNIVAVIDTHLHADHVSGNRDLAAATGAQLYLYETADALFPFEPLQDGGEISLGQVVLRVVHTPGHRPEGLSLLMVNPARSPEPSMVVTWRRTVRGGCGAARLWRTRRGQPRVSQRPEATSARGLRRGVPRPLRRVMRQRHVWSAQQYHRLRAALQPSVAAFRARISPICLPAPGKAPQHDRHPRR